MKWPLLFYILTDVNDWDMCTYESTGGCPACLLDWARLTEMCVKLKYTTELVEV